MPQKEEIIDFFKLLQDHICDAIEQEDGLGKFKEDNWEHTSGGGGRSRVIINGKVIEKGGVNFSAVEGVLTPELKKQLKVEDDNNFTATGVSIVLHPHNPLVPIIHMNVRYFELDNGTYWFGGGIDLTPHYIDETQAKWFHLQLKQACDKFDEAYYPKFKNWADDYFYIPHREETRGIGGVFFDHLHESKDSNKSKKDFFDFVKEIGNTFSKIYIPLMNKNKEKSFDQNNKNWQFLRRGRYVEFNLVWDRGTKFGLVTNGRTESILMSMPPQANWEYNYQVLEGSPEMKTQNLLKKGVNWA